VSTRPLRVVHVDTERGWRGGERQAFWLAERLMWQGHHSVIAARPDEPLATKAEEAKIPVVPLSPFGEMDILSAMSLRRAIINEEADIVHAHSGHAVALAALATMGTRARMVLTRRVSFPLKRNPASLWKYARADAMIAVCRATADALVASGIESARITVAYSGVDLTRVIPPASPETLASLAVRPGAPLVVMVAALVGHKDPLTFVRAMDVARRTVPNVQALMVGEGDLRGAVEREIATLGLGDCVHLAGYRTDADSLMSVADVVSLSSSDDGIGGVVIDAMSFGKPVAATAAGGIPEAVVDGETGLLVPIGDATALGNAIARLITDRALAEQMGANGIRRAPQFSIDNTVTRTLEVYERVLAARSR
jgi:glycosyltransferase involved in cell wall biosynthesis